MKLEAVKLEEEKKMVKEDTRLGLRPMTDGPVDMQLRWANLRAREYHVKGPKKKKNIYYGLEKNNKRGVNQSNQATPSIWAWGKSSSGIRVVIMAAFPRIKLREYLWNRCEVAIDSS